MTEAELFDAVLEIRDPVARAKYLDAACQGDPTLRRQVEALLRSNDGAGSFLMRPAVDRKDLETMQATEIIGGSATDRHASPGEVLAFLEPPERPDSLGRLGHYEMLEVLGRGGFGVVFRASDELLRRDVAVKVLAPHLAGDATARQRFLREARAAAGFDDPHVVRVYRIEEQPTPYLVMDYVPGPTLQQHLARSGPPELRELLRIGRQVACGLAAAHAKGLVHRDVKPANILLE